MITIVFAVLMGRHADTLEKEVDETVAGGIAKGECNGFNGLRAMDEHNLGLIDLAVYDVFNGSVAGLLFEAVGKIVRTELGYLRQFFQRDVFSDMIVYVFYGTGDGILAADRGLVGNGEKGQQFVDAQGDLERRFEPVFFIEGNHVIQPLINLAVGVQLNEGPGVFKDIVREFAGVRTVKMEIEEFEAVFCLIIMLSLIHI